MASKTYTINVQTADSEKVYSAGFAVPIGVTKIIATDMDTSIPAENEFILNSESKELRVGDGKKKWADLKPLLPNKFTKPIDSTSWQKDLKTSIYSIKIGTVAAECKIINSFTNLHFYDESSNEIFFQTKFQYANTTIYSTRNINFTVVIS